MYLMRHYRRGALNGLRLGFGHALYCLGCCWALMLVMFAAGVAHLAWMGVLAAIMFVEKATPVGQPSRRAGRRGARSRLPSIALVAPGAIPGLVRTLTMHVGIAGTGKMGSAMARNLLDRGYRISVWNVDREMMEPLVAAGATPFESLEENGGRASMRRSRCSGTMTSREKSRSAGSFQPHARVSSSSNCRRFRRRCMRRSQQAAAQRGVDFLACPVLGSVDGARTGTLTLLPGGSQSRPSIARANF